MSVNIAILMGRLTADPELRSTTSGISVTNFSIAVDRNYKNGNDKQTDFIDIVAWRNTADFICKYFHKGSMIILQGEIQTRSYEDKEGNKRKAVEVVASNVSFGESKAKDSNDTPPVNRGAAFESFMGRVESMGIDVDYTEVDDGEDLPF